MNDKEIAALLNAQIFRDFCKLVCQRVQFEDTDRVRIAELYEPWQSIAYGNDTFVKYGTTPAGRAQLWKSTRNVPATAPAPGEPSNPVYWAKL